jgi:signal transduction histidine kinase
VESIVDHFARVAEAAERVAPIQELARAIGAESGLMFVLEDELSLYLPAMGTPQTLPRQTRWRELVCDAAAHGEAQGEMVDPVDGLPREALGIASAPVVLVLLGGTPRPQRFPELRPCLALLGRSLVLERRAKAVEGQLAATVDAAQEASRLAQQLDLARRDLERRVQERTAELAAAVAEMEGFTYTVAHDLRAPLRAVVSTSRILEEDFGALLPEEARRLLKRQVAAGRRFGQLVDELLRLSRLAREPLSVHDVDFTTLSRQAAEEVRQAYPGTPVEIRIQEGMTVKGDPRLLALVMVNLIDNALKFSPGGGLIEVCADGPVLSVRDQGMGFDMAFENKIFRPFERLVLPEEIPGTGVGLANVKRIVERHGGRIWAESTPGNGATFYFTLGA